MKIGITGHRKVINPVEVFKRTRNVLLIGQDKHPGCLVYSGMALGFDQLVCKVCLEIGIPFVATVPCDNQDKVWNSDQQAQYQGLLTKAKEIVVVSPGEYQPWKMHARNNWIVDQAKVMVVYWDGDFIGGTGNCMKSVQKKPIKYINVYS